MPRGIPCLPGQVPCIPVHVRLPITAVAEVAVRGHNATTGRPWVNTHAYSLGIPLTSALALDMAAHAISGIVPAMRVAMNNNSMFDDVHVSDYLVPTGVSVTTALPPNTRGINTAAPLPSNVAAVMSYKSASAGRSHNGRQYATGLSEDSHIDDTLTPAYLVAANLAAIAWNTLTATGLVIHPAVASITKGFFTLIISHIMDAFVDSRRKRVIKA